MPQQATDTNAAAEATAAPVAQAEAAKPEIQPTEMRREDLAALGERSYSYEDVAGKRVYFQSLSESERCAIDAAMYDEDGELDEEKWERYRRSHFMAQTLVTSKGVRLYQDDEWKIIAGLNSRITIPIYNALRKHLGLDAAKDEDSAAKN